MHAVAERGRRPRPPALHRAAEGLVAGDLPAVRHAPVVDGLGAQGVRCETRPKNDAIRPRVAGCDAEREWIAGPARTRCRARVGDAIAVSSRRPVLRHLRKAWSPQRREGSANEGRRAAHAKVASPTTAGATSTRSAFWAGYVRPGGAAATSASRLIRFELHAAGDQGAARDPAPRRALPALQWPLQDPRRGMRLHRGCRECARGDGTVCAELDRGIAT